jgi:hypothetical protein
MIGTAWARCTSDCSYNDSLVLLTTSAVIELTRMLVLIMTHWKLLFHGEICSHVNSGLICYMSRRARVSRQRGPCLFIISMNTFTRRLTLRLQLLLQSLSLCISIINEGTLILAMIHLLLRNTFMLRTWLPFIYMLICFQLAWSIALSILFFVLTVCMLLFYALPFFGPLSHWVAILMIRLINSFSVFRRFWR